MELFKLETPVMNKIKSFFDERKAAGKIPANSANVEFLDYKPDEGFLQSVNLDGAVAVFGSEITFPASGGSNTEDQDNESFLTVISYGFGAPLIKNTTPNEIFSTAREAQNRAQNLITLAYMAIMDRREIKGAPKENIEIAFDSGVEFGADKYPLSIKRSETLGAMHSLRGVVMYSATFKFGLIEKPRQEALGVLYDGSDNIKTETTYPPTT